MLGQPITMKLPEVVGVRLTGELPEGATATDLVLHVTEQLREVGVVDRFVEFFGPGVSNLTVPDRATIANMAPEQGSTISMFGVDEATLDYLELTGRDEEHIELVREYFDAQGLFGEQNPEYSETVEFDLSTITPSLAGPKKPQDRVAMGDMKTHFRGLVHGEFEEELDDIDEEAITRWLGESSASDDRPDPDLPEPDVGDLDKRVAVDVNSEGRSPSGSQAEPGDGETTEIGHGSVVVSAITSCTNTSNPSVMIAAGLLARNAVERGLDVPAYVKTSLAPEAASSPNISKRRGFSRTSKTSATTSSATAVRPVSGTPARFPSRSNVRSTPRISGPRASFRGTATSRLASTRRFVRTTSPARRSSSPMASPGGWTSTSNTTRSERMPTAIRSISRTSGPTPTRSTAVHDSVDSSMFEEKYASVFEGDERWTALDAPTGEVYEWDDFFDVHPRAALLQGLPAGRARCHRYRRRPHADAAR